MEPWKERGLRLACSFYLIGASAPACLFVPSLVLALVLAVRTLPCNTNGTCTCTCLHL